MKNLLIVTMFVELALLAGCQSIPEEHRIEYEEVSQKMKIPRYKSKLTGTTTEVTFGYLRMDHKKPWLDITFNEIDPILFEKMFDRIRTTAHEEAPNYSGLGYALKNAIFNSNYSFEPIIGVFEDDNKPKEKDKHDKAIAFLIEEFQKKKEGFDSGTFNFVSFYHQGCDFYFAPMLVEDNQPRIHLKVVDLAAGLANRIVGFSNDKDTICEFMFNYRGHILSSFPERKIKIKQ